jgi:mono/diheme cytochrome c family protein
MKPNANRVLLLVTSLGTLALLLVAAYRENYGREWRRIQREYRAALPQDRAADFSVQLRQIFNPDLKVADRCVSCHVGMASGEEGIGRGKPLLSPHPNVVHDPARFGCVACHGGQGRATDTADAHGEVEHWPVPLIPLRFAQAGCGTCHAHVSVPDLEVTQRGEMLVERYDCLACHSIDGRGGTLRPGGAGAVVSPDLSRVGASGYAQSWYADHLAKHREAKTGPWQTSFGPIGKEDLASMEVFLRSRVGAPALVNAKALFHTLGCRGCHKIGGVGGDDGPDLTREGEIDPHRLDFTHVPGPHTLTNWQVAHLRAPAVVVAGSQMPYLGLLEEQIQSLVGYLLSLRRASAPETYWPKDRIRAERFGKREFATDSATLYGTFCAACHGPRGEGMRYPGMPPFPAIGNPDYLAVASDRFIRQTIQHGRNGRRMAAWGAKDGGLKPIEIEAVVAHVRSFGDGVPSPEENQPRRWVGSNLNDGARLYREQCATCHGPEGHGAEGPALHNQQLLANATDTYLVETVRRGRRGTSMQGFGRPSPVHRALADQEIESIVSFIRNWEEKE